MKYLRYVLMVLAVIVVVIAGMAAYIAATFDPNDYKPQIIELVKQKQQRTLRLDGDIKLAFWPSLGADLGGLSLSEFKSDQEFAAVESARVSLALMPLLSKQLVVNEVTIKGVRASIVRYKDGRMNIDDLLTRDDQKQEQFKFDIDHVAIERSTLNFRDETKGAEYALSDINLKTGRIANGVPTKVSVSLAVKGNQPKLNINADLKTRLTFDLEQQQYALEEIVLEAKGQVADINNLAAKVAGNATASLKTGEFNFGKLSVALTGASGKNNFDVRLDAPQLNFADGKAIGDKVTMVAKITNPQGTTGVNLTLPGIEGTAQVFKSGAMTLDLDVKQGDLTLKSKLSSPVSGNLQTQQVSLPKLVASISASGPNLAGKGVSGEFSGGANIDWAKQNAQANLTGKVGDSNIKARLGVAGFTPPGINFDIEIDQLDADRYLPPQPAGGKSAGAHKQPEQLLDLSGLKNLHAYGTLRIGSLKAAGVKASNVKFDIKPEGPVTKSKKLTADVRR
ncbi:MAG: AsmA family protein [Burkholderiales bacterium]|nr:AsmA family protein [Burkholderiales bacterium]